MAGSVSDQPDIGGQTDAQKTNIGYRPADTSEEIPEPTAGMPDAWKITRLWSNVAEQATDWEYSGIVRRYDPSISGAPTIPTGVDNGAPTADSIRIFWTSTGSFFTEIEWDRDTFPVGEDPTPLWINAGSATTYLNEYLLRDLIRISNTATASDIEIPTTA